jgi:RHS repeat-associated protein
MSGIITPHVDWRGAYAFGTRGTGATDCCTGFVWPAAAMTVDHMTPHQSGMVTWLGGLLQEGKDGSALQYKRNRYYDPKTGRFTQVDPIGLAGGLNAYGFAGGDPVNYGDPFGLCPLGLSAGRSFLCNLIEATSIAAGADLGGILGGGAGVFAGPAAPVAVPAGAYAGMAAGAGIGAVAGRGLTDVLFNSGFNSRTTGRAQIGKQDARVDAELPTDHSSGDVHVQTKGPGGPQKYRITDPNDLSGLPRFLRDNESIQRGIQKAFDLISRFQK